MKCYCLCIKYKPLFIYEYIFVIYQIVRKIQKMSPKKIFIIYSQKNKNFLKELKTQLSPLIKTNNISTNNICLDEVNT